MDAVLLTLRPLKVLGIKNDRLKDGESVIQVQRRPTANAMSQRWDITNGTIHLRNKKELVLTSNVENDSVHVHNPVEGGDPSQRWDMIPRGDEIK
ncbi:hypothetical protein K450DRAFT_254316 [Umbelopsis ramanniana AG]|uniref:Ricin B lectin domain-containing protein n=1 Tax=Umbelopsis ramanniana AG TaxID=1314678 RepID=A0AAD5E548_UMBRA|nr:uncharacterized protein K450DRAFT_254316 [Umbelopsis ramanniana AG]KAI8576939.1 hypothetical protein K450DRAFT_254316 [Umbelopsis ramanniana AG]